MKKILFLIPLLLLTACGGGKVVELKPDSREICVAKYEGTTLTMFIPGSGVEDIEDVSLETAEEVTASVGLCN